MPPIIGTAMHCISSEPVPWLQRIGRSPAIVALYFLFSRRLGDVDRRARLLMAVFAPVAAAGRAFYDGLLGLGTGAFLVAARRACSAKTCAPLPRTPSS